MVWQSANKIPPEYGRTVWLFARYEVPVYETGGKEKIVHEHIYLGKRIDFGDIDDYDAVRTDTLKHERLRKNEVLYWAEYKEPEIRRFLRNFLTTDE